MKIPDELVLNFSKDMTTMGDWQIFCKYSENRIVVEIGTYAGLSAIMFSRFAKKVVTIDNYRKTPFKYECVRDYLNQYNNIEVYRCDSVLFSEKIVDNNFDTLFIDGDHSYEGVKADYNAWQNKVKKGGVIIFHDTDPGHPGSCDFVNDLAKKMKNNNPKYIELTDFCPLYETSCRVFERMY